MSESIYANCVEAEFDSVRTDLYSLMPSLIVSVAVKIGREFSGPSIPLPEHVDLRLLDIQSELYLVKEPNVPDHDRFVGFGGWLQPRNANDILPPKLGDPKGKICELRFQFPLSVLHQIEDIRGGGVPRIRVRLIIHWHWHKEDVGLSKTEHLILWVRQRGSDVLKLDQTEWVKNVLPGMGWGKWRVFEIPVSSQPDEMTDIDKKIETAQERFSRGDWKGCLGACRDGFEHLEPLLEKCVNPYFTDEKREKPADQKIANLADSYKELIDAIGKFRGVSWALVSSGAHDKPVGAFERADAELGLVLLLESRRYVGLRILAKSG